MADRILVVAAHPDDETFGMGGTIARHRKSGDDVRVFILADGVGSRAGYKGGLQIGGISEAIKERHGMCRRACKILGTENVFFYQFTDNAMDTLPMLQVVQQIERHVSLFRPSIVYTHWRGDMNQDHCVVHEATNIACRPQPGCPVKRLLYFEVPCSTVWGQDFAPNYFVDIASTFSLKMEAAVCYESELREPPHPRSTERMAMLAQVRGSQVGIDKAEGFMVGRIVE